MKNLILSVLLIFNTAFMTAQNYQTVEEVDEICSQLGFATDEEAQIAVDRILDEIGIPTKSFKLRSCPNINNAIAKNIKDKNGDYRQYILYDINFMKRISENAANDWSAISILAHEIGHHLSGHSLNNKGSNHKWELEADYFSGVSLAKMGATLKEAQSAIETLRYEKATSTHPSKSDRLREIARGFNKFKPSLVKTTTNKESKKEPKNDFINIETIEEVNLYCGKPTGIESPAIKFAEEIMNTVGLNNKSLPFNILECTNVKNITAAYIENNSQKLERYIFIRKDFIQESEYKARIWAEIGLLAHEIGHFVNAHKMTSDSNRASEEIQADYFAGMTLARMGATSSDVKSFIRKYHDKDINLLSSDKRLLEVAKGWRRGQR